MRVTEKEYRDAYLLWKKEHSGVEKVPYKEIVILPNGTKVSLGRRIYTMKSIYHAMKQGKHYRRYRDLTEDVILWWMRHGLDLDIPLEMRYTEEEYREAYLLWKKENPETGNILSSTIITLPNGKKVSLGRRIYTMRSIYHAMQNKEHFQNYVDLTEEQIAWWTEHGLDFCEKSSRNKRNNIRYTEEEYREAYLLLKEENPETESIKSSTIITLPNGKKIPLGHRISRMRLTYRDMEPGRCRGGLTSEQILWWTEHGVDLSLIQKIGYTEKEYREAYLLWKKDHIEEESIPQSVTVTLPNGKEVNLGRRIATMRLIYSAMQRGESYYSYSNLTEEQISWWTSRGVNLGEIQRRICTEEEYREAYLLWKEENPGVEKVPYEEVVILPNEKKVSLGRRICTMKSIYKAMQMGKHYQRCRDLTEDVILWWTSHGLDLKGKVETEEKIGDLGSVEKPSYQAEKVSEEIPAQNKYQEAYLLWKEKHPGEILVPYDATVELPNGKKVSLGRRIYVMKSIYKAMRNGHHYKGYSDLTEKEISWWTSYGVDLGDQKKSFYTEEEYREAYLLLKKRYGKVENVSSQKIVVLPNGAKVTLGFRMYLMRYIYNAMKQGKHYGTYKDLTEEEISWWTEHGFCFEEIEEIQSKKQNKGTIEFLLSEFHIDFQEFIRSISLAKTTQEEGTFQENIEEQTLKQLCIQGHYNYNIIFSAVKLHSLLLSENLEALIKRITFSMQNKEKIPSWIFEVYGPMINEILLSLNLDSKKIFKDMSEHIVPLERAICNDVFLNTCKRHECDYLEDIYKKILVKINFQASEEENAEEIVNLIVKTGKKNHLMDDEIQVLKECFINYLKKLREYQIIDVGLEENEEKCRKIQKYNLTEDEIEESYFVPFRFESGTVLENKDELYKRRELLRQYTINWDYYTEEEKRKVKGEHHFTEEELSLMDQTRSQINEMIKKMKK